LDVHQKEKRRNRRVCLGKRNLKTAGKLRKKLAEPDVSYIKICPDNWQSFITAFKADHHEVGKDKTVGIEGNNCRIRHRVRRAVRKTCCFSKKWSIADALNV
jgi:IS1 family transposase